MTEFWKSEFDNYNLDILNGLSEGEFWEKYKEITVLHDKISTQHSQILDTLLDIDTTVSNKRAGLRISSGSLTGYEDYDFINLELIRQHTADIYNKVNKKFASIRNVKIHADAVAKKIRDRKRNREYKERKRRELETKNTLINSVPPRPAFGAPRRLYRPQDNYNAPPQHSQHEYRGMKRTLDDVNRKD